MRGRAEPHRSSTASWRIEYYSTASGTAPVVEWLQTLSQEEQGLALGYIDQLALLGVEEAHEPLVKPLRGKLYELRWRGPRGGYRIAYVAVTGRTFLLLHGIVKKRMKWPNRDLDLAEKRFKDYCSRGGR